MSRPRRNWTAKEDSLLQDLVRKELQNSRPLLWRDLAKHIPGRTNKDCRKRWWNNLAGDTVKGPWSQEEDKRLTEAVWKHGTNWNQVASIVGTRCADQCSSHWTQALNPDINYCDWTVEEDEQLLHAVLSHGTNWSKIAATHVPQRTRLALKNRYSKVRLKHQNMCSGKQASKTHPASPSAEAACEIETKTNTQSLQIDDRDETDEEVETERNYNARYHREGETNEDESRERGVEHEDQYNLSLAETPNMWAGCNEPHVTEHNTLPNYGLQTIDEQWLDSVMVAPMSVDPSVMYAGDGIPCSTEELMSMPLVGFDDNAMNLDLDDYQGSLFRELDVLEAQNAQSEKHDVHMDLSLRSDPVVLTPESLGEIYSPRRVSGGSSSTESSVHRVSISMSCTTDQLSNMLTMVAQFGSAVDIKIGSQE